jgi:hypothetical protein
MASFPNLRPLLRLAIAECWGLHRFRSLVSSASIATVSLAAFTAVSELATLRGAKASHRSVFPAGAPSLRASFGRLVGKPTVTGSAA